MARLRNIGRIAGDDTKLYLIRRDLSGGQNNRQAGYQIGENQVTSLLNVDIGVPGETRKRPGLTLIENLTGSYAGTGLFGFEPVGGTNELFATYNTTLTGWPGSGSFTNRKTNFIAGAVAMLKAVEQGEDDVVMIKMAGNNWFRMNQSYSFQDLGNTAGTNNDSPPDSDVSCFFRNRWWILLNNILYYSDAYPSDYSLAFDTPVQNFFVPCGTEQALIPIRDLGIVILGSDSVWSINPSATPAATDKVEKLVDDGCVAGKTAVQVGDDVLYLAVDGVRGLFRTQQDKLQTGNSYPLSFLIKEEVESINWAQISKACAIYFDNKYFISVPVDSSSYNNEVWVYYPASNAWVVISGWNVAAWAKMQVNGEERLYAIDSTNGKVYQAWKGYSDNSTAINYTEEGRKEDFGQPLVKKQGGELKVKALSSGSYNVSVYVSIDDQDYTLLGTMNLAGNAPTLPISLPFTLAGTNIVEETFHLDSLGEWYTIKVKLVHNDTNGNDEIKIYERNIVTYATEYQSE